MTDYDETAEKEIQKILTRKAEQMKLRNKQVWRANFGMIASLGGVFLTPVILGIWIGGLLDEEFPQRFSWRLSLLFLGALWGFVNAYLWIKIEDEKIAVQERRAEEEIQKEE